MNTRPKFKIGDKVATTHDPHIIKTVQDYAWYDDDQCFGYMLNDQGWHLENQLIKAS